MSRVRMVDVALSTAGRGWRVFPLAPGHKTPRRQLTGWEAKATADPARIERWWDRHPADNVGIACGPSGLVVIDLDVAKPGDKPPPKRWAGATGGAEILERLADEHHAELAPTYTVNTPSGGLHLYYRPPTRRQLRNTAGRIGWRIDTRAAGGFVVAAGSIVDGHPYVVVEDTDPLELPPWLLKLADPPQPPRVSRRPAKPPSAAKGYVQAALAGEIQRVLDAPTGARNDTLYRAARALGRFITRGALPRDVVETALQTAGEATGLDPREVTATIRSALDTRPRGSGL